jgi:hypothetical protein
MAENFIEGIGNVLFGTDKAKLSDQIKEKQAQYDAAVGAMKEKYGRELEALKGEYERQMQKQGTVDAQGKLVDAKDVQKDYYDTDYLNNRKEQGNAANSLNIAQSMKQSNLNQARTGQQTNPAQIAAALESSLRTGQQSMANDVRSESLRAKQEALTELGRKSEYARTLTDDQRRNILDRLNMELQGLGLDQTQIANMQSQFEGMSDGLLAQAAQLGAKAGLSLLMNNPAPMMTPTAGV